jgi:hypothetical protein
LNEEDSISQGNPHTLTSVELILTLSKKPVPLMVNNDPPKKEEVIEGTLATVKGKLIVRSELTILAKPTFSMKYSRE